MSQSYKPKGYNSLSPYLIVDNASELIESYIRIFDAEPLRRYEGETGKIVHSEVRIEDSVLMLSDSTEKYPAVKHFLHLYVSDVHKAYKKAIDNGCTPIAEPVNNGGDDPDTRGSFYDAAGNYWSLSTQHDYLEANKSK